MWVPKCEERELTCTHIKFFLEPFNPLSPSPEAIPTSSPL